MKTLKQIDCCLGKIEETVNSANIDGNKTFTGGTTFTGSVTFNGTTDFTNTTIQAGQVFAAGYYVNSVQVVGSRGTAVANATDAASAITQLNLLLARVRAHGLIAT